ncbi:SDR family NAD(P)-dependent oxidoreductase [Umezawaea tangerina]|uniref:NAD(P)-dependent dehydrogenase (Short-subunit alcohol dehydrogenase family) n=1 Tax=Umezawaea tangerina TaxID=84725 RepID=A0A2T0T6S2_9PSEU|nr:SDR family NAD(P)-dependent oxidoreductase [Umezawaea tangerina]PRY41322.1 NAD(P)-dependent dehydrogenase (short-subunit alcohol dehydrogenase family) [Umezawaea tangerina]
MSRRAVVTAGTGGIGLETAAGLAAAGYEVTVVGRDPDRGKRAVERLDAAGTGATARFLAADLVSLASVRALAGQVAAEGRLTVLVNNAGAMFDDRRVGPEGIEATFVLNHLAPYLLTELLLPSLRDGAPSRVVNITSGSVRIGARRFDAAEVPGGYYGLHAYGRAKLANLVHTLDLAERLRGTGVSVFAADPGGAVTDMTTGTMRSSRVVAPWLRPFWPLVLRAFRKTTGGTPAEAAWSSIVAATDPSLDDRTGLVIGRDGRPAAAPRGATAPDLARAVRDLGLRLAPLAGD